MTHIFLNNIILHGVHSFIPSALLFMIGDECKRDIYGRPSVCVSKRAKEKELIVSKLRPNTSQVYCEFK